MELNCFHEQTMQDKKERVIKRMTKRISCNEKKKININIFLILSRVVAL